MLILGMAILLGIHSVSIVAPQWRNAVAARIGEWPWKGIYAIVAMTRFVLLLPVFVLFLASYLPGRIKLGVKHPVLLATKLRATAHLLTNGTGDPGCTGVKVER